MKMQLAKCVCFSYFYQTAVLTEAAASLVCVTLDLCGETKPFPSRGNFCPDSA